MVHLRGEGQRSKGHRCAGLSIDRAGMGLVLALEVSKDKQVRLIDITPSMRSILPSKE